MTLGHSSNSLFFLLGGHDLEMLTLRELLVRENVRFADQALTWGSNKASTYLVELEHALLQRLQPVAVELKDDLPGGLTSRVRWIDHHDERAGADKPCSLRQAFELLRLPESEWSRHFELVAANDVGHARAMAALGATPDEMRAIRAADRAAQGVTESDEAAAALAVRTRQQPLPGLDIVELPHDKATAVADLLDRTLGGEGAENLLVISPSEWNVYGRGDVVQALASRFGGGFGGALPARGYWVSVRDTTRDAVVSEFLQIEIEKSPPLG